MHTFLSTAHYALEIHFFTSSLSLTYMYIEMKSHSLSSPPAQVWPATTRRARRSSWSVTASRPSCAPCRPRRRSSKRRPPSWSEPWSSPTPSLRVGHACYFIKILYIHTYSCVYEFPRNRVETKLFASVFFLCPSLFVSQWLKYIISANNAKLCKARNKVLSQ